VLYRPSQSRCKHPFLHHLNAASKDDTVTDFEKCIDSAIEARLKAVTILIELYLRQQKRSSLQSEADSVVSQPSSKESRDCNESKSRSNTLTKDGETPCVPSRSRQSSWNPFKGLHRTPSAEQAKDSPSAALVARGPSSHVSPPTLCPSVRMSASPGYMNDFRRAPIMTPPISPACRFLQRSVLCSAGDV